LVTLCWSAGRDILAEQRLCGWGAKVIDRLAADPHLAFAEMADAYSDEEFVQQPVA